MVQSVYSEWITSNKIKGNVMKKPDVDSVLETIFDFIALLIGVIIFLVSLHMYIVGDYLNCQCLLLMLLVFSVKNWKESLKRRDEKMFKQLDGNNEKS